MIEVVIPGMRHGEGVINADTAYRGMHCWISGVNADGKQMLSLPYDSAQAAKAFYPVNKYYFEEDYNDTADAVDKLTNGDTIIYYEGGEYITDKFDQASLGLTSGYWSVVEGSLTTSLGKKLYVPGSSTAQATTGLDKLYVSTGVAATRGIPGTLTADRDGDTAPVNGYIGFVVGVYYSDSADAKLRYRIMPSRASDHANF